METVDGSEQLVIDWMDGQPAPQAVLDLLACNCKTNCSLPKCVRLTNGLKCTEMCRLPDCENQASVDNDDEDRTDDTAEELDDYSN
jgi:hypothetical protein